MTSSKRVLSPYLPPRGATAQRPSWSALPVGVRAVVEEHLGMAVIEAESQDSGFTNGFASRLVLANGSRVFLKAASTSTPEVFAAYQREAVVASALPDTVPMPRLLWATKSEQWQMLAFDDVAGRTPQRPWRPGELALILDTLGRLAGALTPAPKGLPVLETTVDIDAEFNFWRRLDADGYESDGSAPRHSLLTHRSRFAELESEWASRAAGDTVVHFDMRDDNLLLTDSGRVFVCDWNWVALAAPWIDLVMLLVSVHGDGLDAQALLSQHPLAAGVDASDINAFLAALGGYFTEAAALPGFDHSPWMRAHQAWLRDASLDWLALRLNL